MAEIGMVHNLPLRLKGQTYKKWGILSGIAIIKTRWLKSQNLVYWLELLTLCDLCGHPSPISLVSTCYFLSKDNIYLPQELFYIKRLYDERFNLRALFSV